jgi:hypothetical protein
MNSFHSNFALDLSIKSIKLQTPYLQESLNSAKNAGRWHALLASSIGGNKRATPKSEKSELLNTSRHLSADTAQFKQQ